MKKITSKWFVIFILLGVLAYGCKKEEDEEVKENNKVEENGLTHDINDLVPKEILDEMQELGMQINTGGNPPDIQKAFNASPFILMNSNRPSDNVGHKFADYKVKFFEQDNNNLKVKLDYLNGPESGNGIGGFIVGDNNEFSVFAKMVTVVWQDTANMVHVISGKLADGGIEDLYFANFMIDNKGNPNGYWIENGEGRVIYDEDGFSEETSFKLADMAKGNGSGGIR